MKKKPKRSNSRKRFLVRLRRLTRHPIRLAGFTLSLMVLLTLFHLLTIGLPGPLMRRITARIQENGIPLRIDSIRLSPRGWVLTNVRLYSPSPDDLKPLLSTENLTLSAWPDNWFRLSKTGWNVSVYGKEIDLSFGPVWEATLRRDNPFRTITRFGATLHVDKQQLQLEESDVLWGGFRIHTRGQVVFSGKPFEYSLPEFGTRATQIADKLGTLQLETEPGINIDFYVDSNAPEKTFVETGLLAENLLWKAQTYNLRAGLNYTNNQVLLNSLQIAQLNGTQLTVTGSLDTETRVAEMDLKNSLSAEALLNLLPEQIQTDLARVELAPFGATEFSATLGPAPAEQLLEQIHADVTRLSVTRKDLTLDPLAFTLTRNGNQLNATNISALVNDGGTLTGIFGMNLSTRAWDTSLQSASAHLQPIGTLVGPGLQTWIDRCDFKGSVPDIQVNISYNGAKGSLQMNGSLSETNFTCADVPFDTLDIGMAYSSRVLTLGSLLVGRGEKRFNGTVEIDFDRKLAQFSATNHFSPTTIARILAPKHPTILERFTFGDAIDATANGQIDYGTWTNHLFSGTLSTKQVSFGGLTADSFKTDIQGSTTQILFTNTAVEFCKGLIGGSAEFDLFMNDGSAPYRIDVSAKRIDFRRLAQQISTDDQNQTRGTFSGDIQLIADAKAGFWKSAQGGGHVEVKDGQLAHLPLFGGLTRIVQTSFAGFNLFSITTLFADYELHDEKLYSENVQFGGTLLSAHAKGNYSPETGLNVKLRVVPLRATRKDKKWYQLHLWSAEALKKTTAPLFGLLEVKLEGPLDDPEWHMVAVPKEIYEIIDRD